MTTSTNPSVVSSEVIPFQFKDTSVTAYADEQGNPWLSANEVCAILGYKNPWDAVATHCKTPGVAKREVGVVTGKKADGTDAIQIVATTYINEGNLYRLIIKSRKPAAEKFEAWVMEEVLPTIRKTGKYEVPTEPAITPAQQNQLQQAIAARFPNGKNRPYAWSRFNNHFSLGSYKQLPTSKVDEALAYIATMEQAKLDSKAEQERLSLYHEAEAAIGQDKWFYAPFQVAGVYLKDLLAKSADLTKQMEAAGIDMTKTEARVDLGCFMDMGLYLMHQFPKMAEEQMKMVIENKEAKLLKHQVKTLTEKLVANG